MYCLVIKRKDNTGFLKSSQAYPFFKCRCFNCIEWKRLKNKQWRSPNAKKHSKKHYIQNREEILNSLKYKYKQNKTNIREYQSFYFKTESGKEAIRRGSRKRRTLKHKVVSESYTEMQVLERYGTKCYLCNLEIDMLAPRQVGKLGWENGLHIEHVVDIALGGPDTLQNVRPSHGICNLRKNKRKCYNSVA